MPAARSLCGWDPDNYIDLNNHKLKDTRCQLSLARQVERLDATSYKERAAGMTAEVYLLLLGGCVILACAKDS